MKILLGIIPILLVIGVMPVFADNESVSILAGSAVPGCEETNVCFSPYEVRVNVGDTVTWSNDDSAAHTVTAGSAGAGPSGIFHSGLLMSSAEFSHTFEASGTFSYFDMVHPWATGLVIVGEEIEDPIAMKVIVEQGEILGIGKTITIKVEGANGTVEIKIIAQDGEIIQTLSSVASSQGEINLPWIIPKDTEPGIYTVRATDVFSSAQTTFEVFSDQRTEIFNTSIIVTVSSDKSSYLFDEVAIISGSVSEEINPVQPEFLPEPIKVHILGPNFDKTISLYPDLNLNYETTLSLHQVLGINEGIYNVTVNYAAATANTSFTVGFEPRYCPALYEPICGVDGITYGNVCELEREGVEFDYNGECKIPPNNSLQEKYDKLLVEHKELQQKYNHLQSILDELKRLFSQF